MAKIAFILLCHKDPKAIIAQAKRLTAAGDFISIHFDARAGADKFAQIQAGLRDNPSVTFAKRRLKCGWGEWSLVQATLYAVEAAYEAFPDASHFYMLSGDCNSIKSAAYAHEFLDTHDKDYIESFDYFTSGWIKTGMKAERLIYRHFVNERKHKKLFYLLMDWQKKLKLERAVPDDIQMMIGSQWWCLRRKTVKKVLEFCRERKDVIRFFRTTWIPDETFFQTVVNHVVAVREIEKRTLTFLMFTDYGMPVTFYNDHFDLLLSQDFLFARKISPESAELKERLGQLWASERTDFVISGEGKKLHGFLTGRGRIGRRYAPRFWENESTLGQERALLMIVCKKWHVAKRLLTTAKRVTRMRGLEYMFDEAGCEIPHLGGLERTLEKRNRHRRAVMRLLFDYFHADEMMICLDPNNVDLMRDFMSDKSSNRILELQCNFDDAYLIGHAHRVGLAREETPPEVVEQLLPTLRHDFDHEASRIREAGFRKHYRVHQNFSVDQNASVLAEFFNIDMDAACEIAETPYLFDD